MLLNIRCLYHVLIVSLVIILTSCAGSGTVVNPPPCGDVTHSSTITDSSHILWGLWQFIADPGEGTLDVVQLRTSNFHLNTLPFLEPPLVNLTIESLEFNGDIIEVDIGLKHPFPGLDQYTGFDVCGIFIINGSSAGFDDPDLCMVGEEYPRLLNPDGYSRWWNPAEFPVNNGTIFSYQDGLLGIPDSIADYNCTINAYKYFSDDLDSDDPLSENTLEKRGMFSVGQKNIRHYTIKVGTEELIFNYAVDACWEPPSGDSPYELPDDFPPAANRPEAWRIDVTETENTLWNDGLGSGGDLNLSIDIYDWYGAAQNTVKVESQGNFNTVTSAVPTGGGAGYSTYEFEILDATPAEWAIDLLISVISENDGYGGLLPGKDVTAYFEHTVTVGGLSNEWDLPICDDVTMRMVNIPAGVVQLGSPDEEWHHDWSEEPYQEVQVPAFAIGKFEVTNEQFECFILAGGYDNHDYWVYDGGWDWKYWQEVTEPYYWSSGQYNSGTSYPDYPVVGVAWFEADAFCRWLSESSGYSVRMAYEDEWERAAEGPSQQLFPWGDAGNNGYGDSEDWAKANTENDVFPDVWHYSAPVGSFPDGASPFGIMDMGGNAWEWLLSVATSQYDDPYVRHSFEFNEEYGSPLLRSGTFQYYGYYLRPAHRFSVYPAHRWLNIGFRVVVEP